MTDDIPVRDAGRAIALAAQTEAAQMLAQIMTVILDPAVPDERVSLLLRLQEKMVADQRRLYFIEAMSRLQPMLPTIDRTGRIVIYSKADREKPGGVPEGTRPIQETPYARQEDIIEAIRPLIGEFGFALNFIPSRAENGRISVKGKLSHVGGHVEEVDITSMEVDSSGNKNNIQGIGSSLKYGMRYATLMLLPCIVSRDPRDGIDNDGASGAKIIAVISEDQCKELATEIEAQGGKTLQAILTAFRIKELADLPAFQFAECKQRLQERRALAAKRMGAGIGGSSNQVPRPPIRTRGNGESGESGSGESVSGSVGKSESVSGSGGSVGVGDSGGDGVSGSGGSVGNGDSGGSSSGSGKSVSGSGSDLGGSGGSGSGSGSDESG